MIERYRREMSRVADKFGVELDEDGGELDDVYEEWSNHVNMTASDLQDWSKNPCSREASLDPKAVIKRNLRLLETPKSEWDEDDVSDAKRTISFISRMRGMRPDRPRQGPHGCPSEWAISLLNWGFNPFDSLPKQNKEVREDLDPVETISMAEHPNTIEAERLAANVWELKDHLGTYHANFGRLARELESEDDNDRVVEIRSELQALIQAMMRRIQDPVEDIRGEPIDPELESNRSYEFTPIPNQVLYTDRGDAMQRATDLGLDGVHEHPVFFGDLSEVPESVREDLTVHYMPGSTHGEWSDRVKGVPNSEREAAQVFHADQERDQEGETEDSVRVQPSAIHEVASEAEVEGSVEDALDELWQD